MYQNVSKIYLRSCSNLLIDTNPRFLPLKKKFTRATSYTILYHPPQKKGAGYNGIEQMMSSQEHFHSYIIYIKMVDVRLHSGSCPSSRTLLSTTSF